MMIPNICCLFYIFERFLRLLPGFHLSGTVKEEGNALYSEADRFYPVSISFDRCVTQPCSAPCTSGKLATVSRALKARFSFALLHAIRITL